MDNQETAYYKSVCDIQDKFIKGEISREEMEQKLEIERLKFIECLRQQNITLQHQMNAEAQDNQLLELLGGTNKRYFPSIEASVEVELIKLELIASKNNATD